MCELIESRPIGGMRADGTGSDCKRPWPGQRFSNIPISRPCIRAPVHPLRIRRLSGPGVPETASQDRWILDCQTCWIHGCLRHGERRRGCKSVATAGQPPLDRRPGPAGRLTIAGASKNLRTADDRSKPRTRPLRDGQAVFIGRQRRTRAAERPAKGPECGKPTSGPAVPGRRKTLGDCTGPESGPIRLGANWPSPPKGGVDSHLAFGIQNVNGSMTDP